MTKQNVTSQGQSFLDSDCTINYNPVDDDIDRMIRDKQNYLDMGINTFEDFKERVLSDTTEYSDSYNCRLFNYPNGQHITFYSNSIKFNSKNNIEHSRKYTKDFIKNNDVDVKAFSNSISRTKNSIYNIARSYNWKWFVTFTFNRDLTNASDFDLVVNRLKNNLWNTKKRYCPNMKYLIVPELHKDGVNYHFHGLMSDIDELQFVFSGKFDKHGRPIFNIPRWKWGWSTATLIGDTSKASSYVTKYITKDTEKFLYNKRRYFTNVKKTVAEKLVVCDKLDFINCYADDITYMKDVVVRESHQKITYIELSNS